MAAILSVSLALWALDLSAYRSAQMISRVMHSTVQSLMATVAAKVNFRNSPTRRCLGSCTTLNAKMASRQVGAVPASHNVPQEWMIYLTCATRKLSSVVAPGNLLAQKALPKTQSRDNVSKTVVKEQQPLVTCAGRTASLARKRVVVLSASRMTWLALQSSRRKSPSHSTW